MTSSVSRRIRSSSSGSTGPSAAPASCKSCIEANGLAAPPGVGKPFSAAGGAAAARRAGRIASARSRRGRPSSRCVGGLARDLEQRGRDALPAVAIAHDLARRATAPGARGVVVQRGVEGGAEARGGGVADDPARLPVPDALGGGGERNGR